MVLEGKTIAAKLIAELKPKIAALNDPSTGLRASPRFFGAALVGDNAASRNFLKQKEKVARELGIDYRLYELPTDITTDKLRDEVGRLAGPKNCGGVNVQLPLPEHLENKHYILNATPKQKEWDLPSQA